MSNDHRRNKMIDNYRKKKEKNKGFDDVINEIKFLQKKGNYSKALTLIDNYLLNNPNDTYVKIYKAMTLFRLERINESIFLYNSILSDQNISNRNKVFAMSQYAVLLSRTNNIDDAIYYFEKVIEESNDLELIARVKLSSLYIDKFQHDKALNILKIDGFNNKFLNVRRAKVYNKMGRHFEALKELNKPERNDYNVFIKENLDDKYIMQEMNYIKGHSLYKLDKYDEALTYLSNATNIKNRDIFFQANITIVRIYLLKNRLDDAIKLCEELKKENISNHYDNIIDELLAKAYLKKSDYLNAEKHYKNAKGNDDRTRRNLGKLELVKGNFEKAEEYFSSLDIKEGNIRAYYEDFHKLALIKFRLKKYDEVLQILDKFEENFDLYDISEMSYEFKRLRLLIEKDNIDTSNLDDFTYSERQIIKYNKKASIEHIYDHHVYNVRTSKFNDYIDIEELFNTIKDKMNDQNITYDDIFDKYIIKYPNIGVNKDNENIHQLAIITLPNTKDIINMYPYDGDESMFNLQELDEKPKVKVKRLSQIEKFNMKYGNN